MTTTAVSSSRIRFPSTNAGPTSYWGLSGEPGVDYDIYAGGVAGGGSNLQPGYPNRGTNTDAAWQIPADAQLPSYIAQGAPTSGVYNVTIAYNNVGNYYNYTRTNLPSGNYVMWARMSSGGGAAGGNNGTPGGEYLNLQATMHGSSSATYTNVGKFIPTINNDWNTYYWYPLTDASGNILEVNMPPGQQTLQLVSNGNCNISYFMFATPPADYPPAITVNPPLSSGVFVSTNKIGFTVSTRLSTVATNSIHTYLNGTDVSASQTFSGSSTNWTVTVPLSLPANQTGETYLISVLDAYGLSNNVSGTFDTFSQNNFMFEAEDFDFNSGQFIDNPVPTSGYVTNGNLAANSYFYYAGGSSLNVSTPGVDLTTSNDVAGETFAYRLLDSCGTEITTDYLRNKFVIAGVTNVDFDVGWWVPGTWLNYTRTIPTNTYLVYGRLAAGGAYSNATMGLVTSGQGRQSIRPHLPWARSRIRTPTGSNHGTGYRCWPPTGSRRWFRWAGRIR